MFIAITPHDHCVYQLMNREAEVIYVGSSSSLFSRLGQHAKTKDWWSHVAGISVESFATKGEMVSREQALIEMINPIHNDTYGLEPALAGASALLGRSVTREDIRAYVAGEIVRTEFRTAPAAEIWPDGVTSLRQFAEDRQMSLQTLIDWRNRRTDFPVEVAEGANRTKLYDPDHLKAYVQARLREPVEAPVE
jgi:hypothetical protein